MKNYLLNRCEIALVILHHLFEDIDNEDVAYIVDKIIGIKCRAVEPSEDTGDVWECGTPFEELVDHSVSDTLDWIAEFAPSLYEYMTLREWTAQYRPGNVLAPIDTVGSILSEADEALSAVLNNTPLNRIWSVFPNGHIHSGHHQNEVTGYFVTEVPWKRPTMVVT
jgi:hypothetical protein